MSSGAVPAAAGSAAPPAMASPAPMDPQPMTHHVAIASLDARDIAERVEDECRQHTQDQGCRSIGEFAPGIAEGSGYRQHAASPGSVAERSGNRRHAASARRGGPLQGVGAGQGHLAGRSGREPHGQRCPRLGHTACGHERTDDRRKRYGNVATEPGCRRAAAWARERGSRVSRSIGPARTGRGTSLPTAAQVDGRWTGRSIREAISERRTATAMSAAWRRQGQGGQRPRHHYQSTEQFVAPYLPDMYGNHHMGNHPMTGNHHMGSHPMMGGHPMGGAGTGHGGHAAQPHHHR